MNGFFQLFTAWGVLLAVILALYLIDKVNTIPSYDEMLRIAPELNKAEKGVNGIGMMCGRGFWATYTWQHIAAQYGLERVWHNAVYTLYRVPHTPRSPFEVCPVE